MDEDGSESSLTYSQLDRRVRVIAAEVQRNAYVGQRVLLVYPAGLEFISAFLGCIYAGVLAVPSTHPKPRRPMPRIATIAEDSNAALALTTSQTLSTLDWSLLPASLQEVKWLPSDEIHGVTADNWRDPGVTEDDLAFLQYTSGSTSEPKGVMISHRNLMSNLEMIHRAFGIESSANTHVAGVGVSWLPPYHDMGLIGGILESIYAGGVSILMSPASFLKRPERWLRAISENRASISGAPNFAYELCLQKIRPEARRQLDLSSWRVAFCGAEPVQAETLSKFAETFASCGFRKEAFFPCYGLAETTLLAAGGSCHDPPAIFSVNRSRLRKEAVAEPSNGKEDAQLLVSCGRPVAQEQLAIVDPTTRLTCPPGKVGEIWVRRSQRGRRILEPRRREREGVRRPVGRG